MKVKSVESIYESIFKLLGFIFAVTLPLFLIVFVMLPDSWKDLGLYDDTTFQWLPIMNKALHQFFAGNGIPYYDFYNFKGMEIFDEGYYGLYNPLIWLAYVIRHFTKIETTVVYIYECMLIGNIVVYLLGEKLKANYATKLILLLSYFGGCGLYGRICWYYIWGNYWIIPAIIVSLFNIYEEKREGIIFLIFTLVFSILSGNIQYTAYHYLIVIMYIAILGICLRKLCKSLKWAVSSLVISISLSAPFLLPLYNAGKRSIYFSDYNSEFFTMPVNPLEYILFHSVPASIVRWFYEGTGQWYMTREEQMFSGLLAWGGIGFLIILTIKTLRKKDNFSINIQYMFGIAGMVIWIFLLLFMGGENFGVAKLFSIIPGFKNFRYLFKLAYIMPPLLLVPTYITLNGAWENRRKWMIVIAFSIILIFFEAQSLKIVISQYNNCYNQDYQYLNAISGQEKENYRCLMITDAEHIQETRQSERVPYGNRNVEAGISTLGGYEMSVGVLPTSLLDFFEWQGWALNYSNAESTLTLKSFYEDEKSWRDFVNSIEEESIKYIIYEGDKFFLIESGLKSAGIDVETIYDKDGLSVFELADSNIKSIVMNSDSKECIDVKKSCLDELNFEVSNVDLVFVNVKFNENLTAYFVDNTGNKTELIVSEEQNGIKIETAGKSGEVILSYESRINDVCILLALIYSMAGFIYAFYNGLIN